MAKDILAVNVHQHLFNGEGGLCDIEGESTVRMRTTGVVLSCMVLFFQNEMKAQEFAREISQFVGENARPFLQPVVEGLNTNMHAGLFTTVNSTEGLHIGVRIVGMGVFVPDERKTFRPKPYSKVVEFTYNGILFLGDLEIVPGEFPTAAGLSRKQTFTGRLKRVRPKGSPYVGGLYDFIQQDATVTVGGYQDLSTILLGTPQITIGSLYGTELILRFLPTVSVENVGEVKSFGVGVKHNIGAHFSFPVDLAGQLMYQSLMLNANDKGYTATLEASTFSGQLSVSKTFSVSEIAGIAPYAGLGYESGTTDLRYEFADPYIGKQNLTFSTGSRVRFLVGVWTKIWKITLNADYNFALMSGFSVGLGVDL